MVETASLEERQALLSKTASSIIAQVWKFMDISEVLDAEVELPAGLTDPTAKYCYCGKG